MKEEILAAFTEVSSRDLQMAGLACVGSGIGCILVGLNLSKAIVIP